MSDRDSKGRFQVGNSLAWRPGQSGHPEGRRNASADLHKRIGDELMGDSGMQRRELEDRWVRSLILNPAIPLSGRLRAYEISREREEGKPRVAVEVSGLDAKGDDELRAEIELAVSVLGPDVAEAEIRRLLGGGDVPVEGN